MEVNPKLADIVPFINSSVMEEIIVILHQYPMSSIGLVILINQIREELGNKEVVGDDEVRRAVVELTRQNRIKVWEKGGPASTKLILTKIGIDTVLSIIMESGLAWERADYLIRVLWRN